MRKLLILMSVMFLGTMSHLNAQNIIDAEEDVDYNHFYTKSLAQGKKAMPYPHVRESDVVWETCIWRKIDFREKFNQFLYFPTNTETNTQGRINIVNTIIKAIENGEIEVFEDDEFKIPQDGEKAIASLTTKRTTQVYAGEDEWGEVVMKDSTVIDPFEPANVYIMNLKEYWYIDKQDTRQKVRIIGMSFKYDQVRLVNGEEISNSIDMFWVPMDDMRVRNVLAKVNAYTETNDALERSYDEIFITRYFDSYITRESNRYVRTVASYLTGQDAIYESQAIEDKIFDIESDMWEY